ncbi:hypothetical protein DES49_1848 [Halospina denitrificans]|uniref:Tetratricopeptide repeat protein n=1 Tax=Halospina denitrificans TaxID=332522 RepID=A0A4R7JV34_9GAMM|nr:hypothetical protein [Halospina denitrificans]TDT41746.1 hypothetical protein DES49_1848 [Halospina denitrificans]
MKRNSGGTKLKRALVGTLTAVVAASVLQGCAGASIAGPTYAAAGTAAAVLHKKRQEFRTNLNRDYNVYKGIFAASECDPEEYQVSPKIMEYLEESAPQEDGYAEAQEILVGIYQDETLATNVRAHALYLMALTEAEKENGSREKARAYLRRVKKEFPGTHDCAVDVMLEKGRIITNM